MSKTDSHFFNVDIAKKHGVEEAIIIQNLYFWITKNRANSKNFYDGSYWTYNSTRAFQELFPYWTENQITRILNSLKNKGVIKTGNYNKTYFDRTLWYAFTEEFIKENDWNLLTNANEQKKESIPPNSEMDNDKQENRFNQTEEPIPDINTDNKPNEKRDTKKPNKKENVHKEIYDTYIQNYKEIKGAEPNILYSRMSKTITSLLNQGITKEQLIHAIKQARYNNFTNGKTDYLLNIILSENVLQGLINEKPSYSTPTQNTPRSKEYCKCGGEIKYGVCIECGEEA